MGVVRRLLPVFALVLASLLASSWPSFAGGIKVGNEFTFECPDELAPKMLQKYAESVKQTCARLKLLCQIVVDTNILNETGYVETWVRRTPDGPPLFRVEAMKDEGVLEIRGLAHTLPEIEGFAQELHAVTFEAMNQIGLVPHSIDGGGHIHMGVTEAFGDDAAAFRNFIVDYANHPEVSLAFGGDPQNAPWTLDWSTHQKEAFAQVIAEFDAAKEPWDIEKLARELENRVYIHSKNSFQPPRKFQGLSLKRILKGANKGSWTIEFRGLAPQDSVSEFILQARLFTQRAKYVVEQTKKGIRVAFEPPPERSTPRELMLRFRNYVRETGLNRSLYDRLIRDPEMFEAARSDDGLLLAVRELCGMRISPKR